MKTKLMIVFASGAILGGLVTNSIAPLRSYFSSANQVNQGKELLRLVHEQEKITGAPPSAEWYYSLERQRVSSEGRTWIYFEKPIQTDYRGGLRLVVPVAYGHQYLGVYEDGAVISTSLENPD